MQDPKSINNPLYKMIYSVYFMIQMTKIYFPDISGLHLQFLKMLQSCKKWNGCLVNEGNLRSGTSCQEEQPLKDGHFQSHPLTSGKERGAGVESAKDQWLSQSWWPNEASIKTLKDNGFQRASKLVNTRRCVVYGIPGKDTEAPCLVYLFIWLLNHNL